MDKGNNLCCLNIHQKMMFCKYLQTIFGKKIEDCRQPINSLQEQIPSKSVTTLKVRIQGFSGFRGNGTLFRGNGCQRDCD